MIGEAMAAKVHEERARIESARRKEEEAKKGKDDGDAIIAIQAISSDSDFCPNIEV